MIDPVEHNFSVYQGQTLQYPFTVWNDDALSVPYDFTSHTVASQARTTYDSTKAINLNASIGGNTVYLNATPAQLASFVVQSNNKSAKYYYDIEITKPDNSKWTLARGVIEVFPEVTKI
ncbi:MAG: hypothetical protein HUM72_12490 [Dolichospermum sp.]|nr:hypothetical protein [Dolichospermum sp.]